MKFQFHKTLSIIALTVGLFSSCTKTDTLHVPNAGTPSLQSRNLKIMLTGGVANAQNVMIDIQKIEVKAANVSTSMTLADILANDSNLDDAQKPTDEFGHWEEANFQPQTIDVSSLKNGLEQILSNVSLSSRALKVRLTIGDGSYTVDSLGNQTSLSLADPSDNLVYITLTDDVLDMDESPADAVLHLNFDLSNSVIDNSGTYTLKPQIRAFSNSSFGEVNGAIDQVGIQAKVSLVDVNGYSTSTVSEADGSFRFRGIKPGAGYSVKIDINGFQANVINDINVSKGKSTDLGMIAIQ